MLLGTRQESKIFVSSFGGLKFKSCNDEPILRCKSLVTPFTTRHIWWLPWKSLNKRVYLSLQPVARTSGKSSRFQMNIEGSTCNHAPWRDNKAFLFCKKGCERNRFLWKLETSLVNWSPQLKEEKVTFHRFERAYATRQEFVSIAHKLWAVKFRIVSNLCRNGTFWKQETVSLLLQTAMMDGGIGWQTFWKKIKICFVLLISHISLAAIDGEAWMKNDR